MPAFPNSLDDPRFVQITYRNGASGIPRPILRSTGIGVQTLWVASTVWNESPEQIAEEYGLRIDQVEEALAFCKAHRVEIEASLALDHALAESAA